jgi:hypothetical protein
MADFLGNTKALPTQDLIPEPFLPEAGTHKICRHHQLREWQTEHVLPGEAYVFYFGAGLSSPWVDKGPRHELESKLEPLYNLDDNWDSYGAPAPSPQTLAFVRRILAWLEHPSYRPSGIIASAEGGVALCFVRGDKYGHVEILNSGEVTQVMYEGKQRPIVRELSQSESAIGKALEDIREYLAD